MSDVVPVVVDGITVQCTAERPLFNELINAKIFVQTACGGKGTCFLCRVTIKAGREVLPPPTAAENRGLGNVLIAMGMRLSCQIPVRPGLVVERPVYESRDSRKARKVKGDKPL